MSYPPGSSVFWGRPGGVTHIWLWLGGLQRNKRRVGAVRWAMQGQSGRFVYDATISGVQCPAPGPRTLWHKWSICHLCISMGVQFGYSFPLRSNVPQWLKRRCTMNYSSMIMTYWYYTPRSLNITRSRLILVCTLVMVYTLTHTQTS